LTKDKFDLIVGDILNQFSSQGLIINEGIAIDARIVRSASRPKSNKTLDKIRSERATPEGKLDKNGNPLKFSRDIESNWVSKNAKLTSYEINRNKGISKVRYIVEQYFGLSHLYDSGKRARFTTIAKNNIDIWFRQVAFNIRRGFNIFKKRAAAA
jgi:hypothetical protein